MFFLENTTHWAGVVKLEKYNFSATIWANREIKISLTLRVLEFTGFEYADGKLITKWGQFQSKSDLIRVNVGPS